MASMSPPWMALPPMTASVSKDGNGDDLTVGVDSAPIADGDAFQIVLTTY